ncbi:MAG: SDR family oxidoreductase, partial [Thermodesulfobacteriota bacterium]
MSGLAGKTVFLTGAAGGLGRALGRRFGRAGAAVAASDLDEKALEELAADLAGLGIQSRAYRLDVTDEAACHEVMNRAAADFGRLDVLINNAGITHRSAFIRTQSQVFRRVMEVNFFGSLYCTQAALPHLIKTRGLLVVISSVAGFSPLLGRTGYSASKHALHGLFDSLRAELREAGVGVTLVCPSFVATGINRHALDFDGAPARHPQATVGRVATPEAAAEAIFQAARKRKRLAVLSAVGKLSWLVSRISPALYEKIMTQA